MIHKINNALVIKLIIDTHTHSLSLSLSLSLSSRKSKLLDYQQRPLHSRFNFQDIIYVLFDMYAKKGILTQAQELFDKDPIQSVGLWTVYIWIC